MGRTSRNLLLLALVFGASCSDGSAKSGRDASPPADASHAVGDGAPDAGPDASGDASSADGSAARVDAHQDRCGDQRTAQHVYFGTLSPTSVPLSPGQVLAIGSFGDCSGTLIGPRWVLTARHCGLQAGDSFCTGPDPHAPQVCLSVRQVRQHPEADLALAKLERDARERLPAISPIPLFTDGLGPDWVGRTAEAAGYGETENGTSGTRKFTAEPIVEVGADRFTIDGMGERGVCFGDSGGPGLVVAEDGFARLAGVLAAGDESCVGLDHFARVDANLRWVKERAATRPAEEQSGCGPLGPRGRCFSDLAVWCDGEQRRAERCDSDSRCGWDERKQGFRCITGADPCEGYDGFGECEDGRARWCQDGELKSRNCGACGKGCAIVPERGGVYCKTDPCMGLDYQGECRDGVARWCEDGQLQTRDCQAEGGECRYIDDETGHFCDFCGELDYTGRCNDGVAEWCEDGERQTRDCEAEGSECRFIDDETGYYCTDD